MSDIAPLYGPSAASYTPANRLSRPASSPTGPSRQADQIDVSDTAKLLSKLSDQPDIRQELVDRVRAEIAAGTYETPEKLDAAVEGLAQDLA
jgi:negative regulator of flagellin synthesis FlgM